MNKLGGYIERVKGVAIYNKNIPIKGLSIEKCFVESRIVNLSNIKNKLQIVKRDQFCYKPSTARNGDKLSIALNSQLDAIQISNTYVVFYIKQPDKLINHYLELWIKRIAFDKLARYLSTGGVREELTYERFCSIPIVVPALEEQKKIVYKYQTIEKLIQNKRKINELLEGWMKSYYHILFDNLEEFTSEILGNLFQVLKGSQPPKSNFYLEKLYFCKQGGIPFLRTKDIFECKFLNSTSEQLTEAGFKRCKAKLIPENGLIFVGTAGRQGGRLLINQLKTLIISPNLWVIEWGGQKQFAYFLYLLFD